MLRDSDFKEIDLGDKEVFDKYISKKIHDNSEFNFTNFFIWRHHYKLNFSIYENHFCTSTIRPIT
jgi:hypothetical protein